MAKFFDIIKGVLNQPLEPTRPQVRDFFSRVTPDPIENRIPRSAKDKLALLLGRDTEGEKSNPTPLDFDALVGRKLATPIPQGHIGPINPRGITEQLLRPSNLLPVSRAGSLLKARAVGPPLFRALAQEGIFAGAFNAAETQRLGGSRRETAEAFGVGTVLGALTPIGIEGIRTGISPIMRHALGRTAPDTVSRTSSESLSGDLPGERVEALAYRGAPPGTDPRAAGIGGGRFFTPSEATARAYATDVGEVISEKISLKNALVVENWFQAKEKLGLPRSTTMVQLLRELKSLGYDGLVTTTGGVEYVDLRDVKAPSRISRMTPEQRAAATTTDQTIEQALARYDKEIVGLDSRIPDYEARVKEPVISRPEGKVGGRYLEDLYTVDDQRYAVRQIQADAGVRESRPIAVMGSHNLKEGPVKARTIKDADGTVHTERVAEKRSVALNQQEAEVLNALWTDNPNPSISEIKMVLRSVEGPSVRTARGTMSPASELLGETRQASTRERRVTTARAQLIKEYMETRAQRADRAILRPQSHTPAYYTARGELATIRSSLWQVWNKIDTLRNKAGFSGPSAKPPKFEPMGEVRSDLEGDLAAARKQLKNWKHEAQGLHASIPRVGPGSARGKAAVERLNQLIPLIKGAQDQVDDLEYEVIRSRDVPEEVEVVEPRAAEAAPEPVELDDAAREKLANEYETFISEQSDLLDGLNESPKRERTKVTNKLFDDLRERGFDVGEAEDALEEFNTLERSGMTPDEWREERESLWETFVDTVREIDPESGDFEIPTPSAEPAAKKVTAEVVPTTTKPNPEAVGIAAREIKALQEEEAALRKQLSALLGVDPVPVEAEAQMALLTQKYATMEGQPPILPPSRAQGVLDEATAHIEKQRADYQRKLALAKADRARLKLGRDAIANGSTNGRVPLAGNVKAHSYEELKLALTKLDRVKGPRSRATVAEESLADYAQLGFLSAYYDTLGRITKGGAVRERSERLLSTLRNLGEKLTNAPEGTGAKVTARVNGRKVYGNIKGIHPVGAAFTEWIVDFVPIAKKTSNVAVGLRVKDIKLEYERKYGVDPATGKETVTKDTISQRYSHEKDIIDNLRSEESGRVLRHAGMTGEALSAMGAEPRLNVDPDVEVTNELVTLIQRQIAKLNENPLRVTEIQSKTQADLDRALDDALAARDATLTSYDQLSPAERPGQILRDIYSGLQEIQLKSRVPANEAKAETQRKAMNLIAKDVRDRMHEMSGIAYDHPLMDSMDSPEHLRDGIRAQDYLRGQSTHAADFVNDSVASKLPRKLRNVMRTFSGNVFPDINVWGLNAWFHNADATTTRGVGYKVSTVLNAMRQAARQLAAKDGTIETSWRPDFIRQAAGDTEMSSALAKHFKLPRAINTPEPELKAALEVIEALADEPRAQFTDWFSRQPWSFIRYPDFYRGIPDDFVQIGNFGRAMLDDYRLLPETTQATKTANTYVNKLMIDERLRDEINTDLLADGSPLQVMAEAVRLGHRHGMSVNESLSGGQNLLMTEPLSILKADTSDTLVRRLMELAPPGGTIKRGVGQNISHTPGRWEFKGLDEWKVVDDDGNPDWVATKDLQDSLRALQQNLNGMPDWKGLTKLSQNVANTVLTMDGGMASVQATAALSSRIIYDLFGAIGDVATLKPSALAARGKSFANYFNGLKTIMSDEGYQAWLSDPNIFDDMMLFSSRGLKTGAESYIGGASAGRTPLENIPFIGRGAKVLGDFNDLQFNRILTYLKFMGVQQQIKQAHMFRNIPHSVATGFMKGLPGVKDVVDEAGGDYAYLNGPPMQIVDAAIRSQNNKLGGISIEAHGVGAKRQALEQILTIVPGFLRAQAGMMSTAMTRPNTVEGWMATTGVAEELLLLGAVGYMGSLMTGNEDKFNFWDVRRADWLAAQNDGSYLPLIPRVGIPRLAARTITETIDGLQGNGYDLGGATKSFAMGRFSPLVNATVGPTFFDEDFLGRKYRDKKDRMFAGITSFMPIFMENLAVDAREGMAKDGWSALPEVAEQTPLQFLGKNVVPRTPIDRLNEYAQKWSSAETPDAAGRNWFDLNPDEQDVLKQNPDVQAAVSDWDYYNQRRNSPQEQQIETAFNIATLETEKLRTQPFMFKGLSVSMADAYDLLLAGDPRMTGDDYRERYRYVSGQIAQVWNGTKLRLDELGFDLNDKHDKRVTRLRELFKDSDAKGIEAQLAIWDLEKISPDDPMFVNTEKVQTPNGEVEISETDWDAYQAARDSALDRYDGDVKIAALQRLDKWEQEGINAYKESSKKRAAIEDLPRYRGLANDQADKLDAMTKSFRDIRDLVRAKIGLPGFIAEFPPGLSNALRGYAIKKMVQEGFIANKADAQIAMLAIAMEEKPALREVMRGPEQLSALINNPDVILFYPYLLTRIPVYLRGKLPQQLQPQFDVWNRYEAMAS